MIALLAAVTLAAAHPADPSPYFLDNATILYVDCDDASGTAFYVGDGKFITARHVVLKGDNEHAPPAHCSINSKPVRIIELGRGKVDYALISAPVYPQYRAIVSCQPFQEGQAYFASGYASGNEWVVTQRLIGSSNHVTDRSDLDYGASYLRGSTTAGQSGGPVSDNDGVVHGIVSGGPTDGMTEADILALADTPYCERASR